MNAFSRGIRNAFRNTIRTFSIVIILGLSVGLALSMLVARQAVQEKISIVKSSVGNTISISPAGSRGFQGGGEPLTMAMISKVSSVAHVTKVVESLNDRLTTSDTNLISAIEAGTLGNRQAGNSGVGFRTQPDDVSRQRSPSGTTQFTRTFTPPIIVTGVSDVSSATAYGGSTVKYINGLAFDPSVDKNVAVIGSALANKNNLIVGSNFTVYDTNISVVGIYDSGTTFSNAGLLMPLITLQRLSAQVGNVSSVIVSVDSIDNVADATTTIKAQLGTTADVTNDQLTAESTVTPLESVKNISLYSLIGALIAGAVIILFTMMMIVRERRREIGVMKALGSSNFKTMFQFITEAITLTMLGMIVGILIGVAAANPVTKLLVNNSASNSSTSQNFGGATRVRGGFRNFGQNSVTNIRNIKTSVGVGTLVDGVGIAFAIAIVGSAVPALLISKVRPADVMRAE
jgi:putative ABC transport system permease protein